MCVVQEFVVDRCEEMVIVDSVVPKSAAHKASIRKVRQSYTLVVHVYSYCSARVLIL